VLVEILEILDVLGKQPHGCLLAVGPGSEKSASDKSRCGAAVPTCGKRSLCALRCDARYRRAERRPGERICLNRQTLALHRHQGSRAGTKLLVREFTAPTHARRARKGERYPQFSTSDRQEAARFQSTSETRNDFLDFRNNPVNRSAREGK